MVFPQTPLPICNEIYVNGAWVDITNKTYSRDAINIKRGRADEASTVSPGSATLTLNNRAGAFSPRNPLGAYYGQIGRNTPARISVKGTSYLQLQQPTGNTVGTEYVSTPDNAALDITGDIDLRFDADLTTWTEDMELLQKWDSAGNQRSYGLFLTGNKLQFAYSPDGSNLETFDSTWLLPVTTGRLAVRAIFGVNNGGGGRTVIFYTAPNINSGWTQLGSDVTRSGTTSIFSGSAPLTIIDGPASGLGGSVIRGKVFAAQVWSGFGGTLVANPDFTAQTHGATSFVDSVGRTWTLNGTVELSTRDIRFTGEVASWPQKWDVTGKDVYTPVEYGGILRRLSQGNLPLPSAMTAGYPKVAGVVAYWPMEDGSGSTSLASGLSTGLPMKIIGSPNLASDSTFACSKPIPVVNNATLTAGVIPYVSAANQAQVQWLQHIPDSGDTDLGVLARISFTGGTVGKFDVIYGTGGTMRVQPYDSAGAAIGSTSPIGFVADGLHHRVRFQFLQNGGNVDWTFGVRLVGVVNSNVGTSGTITGYTLGTVSRVAFNPLLTLDGTSVGQAIVLDRTLDTTEQNQLLDAFVGEAAGRRIQRLCRDAGVTIQGDGNLSDTALMGAQLPDTLVNLLQDCANTDLGILYECRDQYAIGYRPRSVMYNHPADLTLSYSGHQMNALEPVEDDQLLANDVTATRTNGSSYRATQTTGRLSTSPPPAGVGSYPSNPTINVSSDDVLDDQAGWRLRLGTLDEARYPSVPLSLQSPAFANNAALTLGAANIDVGDRVLITNPPAWLPPEDISQIVQGTSEVLLQYQRDLTFNCSPSSPYDTIGVYGISSTVSRYSGSGTSTLQTGVNSTATTLSILTASGVLWTHIDGDYDIIMAGERMTVKNVTGASSPQSVTVVRSVNGIVKAQVAGASFGLFAPAYYAL